MSEKMVITLPREENNKWHTQNPKDMKKIIMLLAVLLSIAASTNAMSYQEARDRALFLTDKMAYELNLNDEQYEAAYEINLDYLLGVSTYDDLYGMYWRQRNADLSYILMDWQYRAYCAASYFYRPLYWDAGYWHFAVYARYPARDYYYFRQPRVYVSYTGRLHSWGYNGGRSWYYDHRPRYYRSTDNYVGMRNRWDNGHYGNGRRYSSVDSRSYRGQDGRIGTNSRTWDTSNRTTYGYNNRPSTGSRTWSSPQPSTTNTTSNSNRSWNRAQEQHVQGGGVGGQRTFGTSRESSTRTTGSRPSTSRYFGNDTSTPSGTFRPNTGSRSWGNNTPSVPTTRSRDNGSSSGRSWGNSVPSGRSWGSGSSSAPTTRSFGSSGASNRPSGGRFGSRR